MDLFAEIRITEGTGTPRTLHKVPLELLGNTVVPALSFGETWIPVSTEVKVEIEARLIAIAAMPRGCQASDTIDPNQEIVIAGSLRDLQLTLV